MRKKSRFDQTRRARSSRVIIILASVQDGVRYLGKASKYRHRVTPMPINRVPIFSDSVSIGTDLNGIGNGSNFFIGPITDIISSWLISVNVYQRIVIVSHATLLTKVMLGNVYVNKSEAREWLSFQCTNRLGKNCLSAYCILSKCALFQKKRRRRKKKSDKRLNRRFLIDDNTRP